MDLYLNCYGAFLTNKKIEKKHLFTEKEILEFQENKQKIIKKYEKEWKTKYKGTSSELINNYKEYRTANLIIAKNKVSQSVNEDNLIIQAVSLVEELDTIINILSKRLREWSSLEMPELANKIQDNEEFARKSLKKQESKLGKQLHKKDTNQYNILATKIIDLFKLKQDNLDYLENLMSTYCKNTLEIAGPSLTGKLLKHAGSLKKLALMPSSKIQLLGAEKALFRHLITGSKSPKHGLILQHKYVQQSRNKGKAARILADKIAIAIKVDYFKGKPIGNKLKKELK